MNTTSGHLHLKEPIDLAQTTSEWLAEHVAVLMQERTGQAGFEDFCRFGGSVAEAEVALALDPFDENVQMITGKFDVCFEESYYSGCKDIDWREKYRGHGTVVIDVVRGFVQIETEAQHVPDPRDAPNIDDENESDGSQGKPG